MAQLKGQALTQFYQDAEQSVSKPNFGEKTIVIHLPHSDIIWSDFQNGIARTETPDEGKTSYRWWNTSGVERVHPHQRQTEVKGWR